VFPSDAGPLFDLYRRLHEATDAAMSPLVGRTLETLGYDRGYSLRPHAIPAAVPAWRDTVAWNGSELTTLRPVVVDVGAAGKGYLVDIIGALLADHGVADFVVDASGDILHAGDAAIRVALENPFDPTRAIGVVNLRDASLCASASNRRVWGDGLHHIIDATTGLPTRGVVATWAIAASGLVADGLATALFFAEPDRLAREFEFGFVRMFADGRVESSAGLDGELFT
jgi:thiamine biosynthesis lipoprotein